MSVEQAIKLVHVARDDVIVPYDDETDTAMAEEGPCDVNVLEDGDCDADATDIAAFEPYRKPEGRSDDVD
eukprot:2534639-Karenia_brevis.AAC.1